MNNPKLNESELFPKQATKDLYDETVKTLLIKARDKDEKEFISSILYFRGMMTLRSYDVSKELGETIELFFGLATLKESNPQIMTLQSFFKLGLLVYCHIIETYPTFEFLYNLGIIAQGKDYELHPFGNEGKGLSQVDSNALLDEIAREKDFATQKRLISKLSYKLRISDMPVVARIQKVIKESKKAGISLEPILDDIYDKDIRNAFSHGLYSLDSNGMMLIRKNKLVPYRDLLDKITKCLLFYVTLVDQSNDVLAAFPANKKSTFKGRLGEMSITPRVENGFISYLIQSTSLGKHI